MLETLLRNSAVQTVIEAVINLRLYLYLFAGIGALIALRAFFLSRRERSRALFGLERESASERMSQAFLALFLMAAIGGGVYFVTNYLTPEAIAQRLEARARAAATATAQARATDTAAQVAKAALTPSVTPRPATLTPTAAPPPPTNTPEPPKPPDLTVSCHGEGNPIQLRFVDRQGVNLRRSPEFRNDNIERLLQFSNEVCVYGEETVGTDLWLKVTVVGIEGYRYILKNLTRE